MPTITPSGNMIMTDKVLNGLMPTTKKKTYTPLYVKEKRKTYTEDQLIELLASDGMYVKRPIVIGKNRIIIGNKPDAYTSLK